MKDAGNLLFAEIPSCYIGHGFSDQCYLIRTQDFRQRIYQEPMHFSSTISPDHGGELFEKRVNSWLRNHQFLRATYKHALYWHENIE